MRAQRFLLMVSKRDEEKQSRQKCDDDNADRGARQELEMKMFWAEKATLRSAGKFLAV